MNSVATTGAVLTLMLVLLVAAALLPLLSHRSWLVRGLDFPRVQLMWVAIGLLVLTLTIPSLSPTMTFVLCAGLSFCAVAQARHILRFCPWARKEVADAIQSTPDRSLKLLIANVLMTNERSDSLVAVVASYRPDIVLTLETNQRWEESISSLAEHYPFRVAQAQDNLYGMHLFSILPLAESTISFLVESDVPSIHTLIELPSGDTIRAHFLHPAPPSPSENPSSEERDSELILMAKSLESDGLPAIVGGDLNDVGWSRTTALFKSISGLRDVRIGRGLFCTYNAKIWFLRWPLDHLFVSSHFSVNRLERVPIRGSDHFALFTDILLQSSVEVDASQPNLSAREVSHIADTLDSQDASVGDVPQPRQ